MSNQGYEGGFLYDNTSRIIQLVSSTFNDNCGVLGGGVLAGAVTNDLLIYDSTFLNNMCDTDTGGSIRILDFKTI